MKTIYHVAPAGHNGNLESLHQQHGEDAYEIYAERWPEAGELGQYHTRYVHCYETLEEAMNHPVEGKIYAIDVEALNDDFIEVEIDRLEFPHPMVRDEIPAKYITEVK